MSMTESEYTNEQLIDFMYDVMDWRDAEDAPMIYAVIEALKERHAYGTIGTIERFRELTEKAEPKKPYIQQVEIDYYEHDCMECPSCDSFLGYASDCKEEHYQDNYCRNCGQRLDWQ